MLAEPGFARGLVLHSDARGDVAQLGEHCVRIAGVRGSSPLISTIGSPSTRIEQPTSVTVLPEASPIADRAAPDPARRFLAATVGYVVTLWLLYGLFVATEVGQRLENSALQASTLRGVEVRADSLAYLSGVSVATFVGAMAVIALVAMLRRRPGLGVLAVATMAASVLVAETLKDTLPRPELVEGPVWILRNSFPSGTATVAASVSMGALLVAPDRLRWLVLPAAVALTAVVGQATQVTGWHRASDALGGVVLTGSFASAGLLALALNRHVRPSNLGRVHPRVFALILALAGLAVVVGLALLAAFAAFPLLRAPADSESAFLQTSSDLIAVGLTTVAIAVFAWIIEPYTLGVTAQAGTRGAIAAPAQVDEPAATTDILAVPTDDEASGSG